MDEISSDPEIMDSKYIEPPEEVDTDTALSPPSSFSWKEFRLTWWHTIILRIHGRQKETYLDTFVILGLTNAVLLVSF